jgi:hypothetical protein
MFTTEFSCKLMKKKHANWSGFLFAMAITAVVALVVLMYAGEKAPRGAENVVPWLWISMLVFGAPAIWIYVTKRFKLIIDGRNDKLTVEIQDPSLGMPLIFTTPFTLSTQWTEQYMGKGAKMRLLYVTLVDQKGEKLVTFEGTLGTAYSVPSKFEYLDLINESDRKRFCIAEKSYSTGKARDIASEIHAYLTYLERKKATSK